MDPILATALEAAEAAAAVHLKYLGEVGVSGAREKAHSDFVTRVDMEAQAAAVDVIARRFPHHRILAEEEVGHPDEQGGKPSLLRRERTWPENGTFLWIIDPLDGTTNFLHRHPFFAASVGVGRLGPVGVGQLGKESASPRGVLEAGAVVAPRTGERWWARKGAGARKNGLPIRVSDLRSFKSALVGTGFPFKEPGLVPRYLAEFGRVLPESGGVRRTGSAALDLCYLAEGILDAFWEEDYLSPWDVAAGLVILAEAGGLASRMDGSEIDLADGSIMAANSPELLGELAARLLSPRTESRSSGS